MAEVLRRMGGKSGCEIDFFDAYSSWNHGRGGDARLASVGIFVEEEAPGDGPACKRAHRELVEGEAVGTHALAVAGEEVDLGQRVTVEMRGCMAAVHWLREAQAETFLPKGQQHSREKAGRHTALMPWQLGLLVQSSTDPTP